MQAIDWVMIVLPLVVCGVIAVYARRHVHGVADFMAGGRNAGRFLLCTARSEQGAGAVMFVATFQIFVVAGFSLNWWNQIQVPAVLILSTTGFVFYRFRQTRALTIGQFFEMRYSRRFRLFAGGLAFFAGLINFGVIPIIGARFMVYFLELPPVVHVFGHDVRTALLLMALFLTICTIMTTAGGQISVLLTDCAEGMFSQVFYIIIAVGLLAMFFKWSHTRAVLTSGPPGKSLVNPFDSSGIKNFNLWYVLMGLASTVYSTMAWQNSHAFNASATSPHEARMGSIIGKWRSFAAGVMITMLCVCALTYLHTPEGAAIVQKTLGSISDPSTADQMRVPTALAHLLPVGLKGALLSICLMGLIAGDGIHLHSWSSLLIQDVIVPLRRRPLSVERHLLLLRLAIVGVAIFAFIFGALFPQAEYVQLWFSVTQAIYTGGAGAAIIGGLYWAGGTTAGAWVGFLVGSILSFGGIVTRVYWQHAMGREFPLNGLQIGFFASIIAVVCYIVVSKLTCRQPHDMDRLLNRGPYAVEPEANDEPVHVPRVIAIAERRRLAWVERLVGIDEHFTREDRWITLGIFWWSITWFTVFAIGSLAYFVHPWSDAVWADYWLITGIYLPLPIGIITTVWFTFGCWRDMRLFFRRLREERVDASDDGTVT